MKKVLYIDTETTGLSSISNGLTEVACIIVIDDVEVDKFLLQINTSTYKKEVDFDDYALNLTNKSIEDIHSYPDSSRQFEVFLNQVGKYIDKFDKADKFQISGYNVSFDIGFIQSWFHDNDNKFYGSYFSYKDLDVFAMVKHFKHLGLIDTPDDKLLTICEHFNIPLDAHNALDDIIATKKLDEILTDKFIITNAS